MVGDGMEVAAGVEGRSTDAVSDDTRTRENEVVSSELGSVPLLSKLSLRRGDVLGLTANSNEMRAIRSNHFQTFRRNSCCLAAVAVLLPSREVKPWLTTEQGCTCR
jgi:hypothetical protein